MAEGSKDPRQFLSFVIILAISVVFVLQWGPGSRGCDVSWKSKTLNAAALVNGREIASRDYIQQYTRVRQANGNFPESLARQLGYPKQVLDFMVDEELMSQAAERHGVTASDDEIREILLKQPDFQKDGRFDPEHYKEVVREYYRLTETDYEDRLRRRLSAEKMADLVQGAAVVSDDEVRARFFKEGNKAEVTFVRFLPAMFASKVAAPSPAVLAQYAKDHEKDISTYYEANRAVYHQPERAHVRQILIRLAPDASADQKAAAKAKAEGIRRQLDQGKDFGALAKDLSEDPGSKDRGGDLGFNDRSAFAPEVAQVAFALKAGDLSQPVESHFGYHLLKLEELKAAEDRPLAAVQSDIARQLYVSAKAKELASAAAQQAQRDAAAGKALVDLFPPDKDKDATAKSFNFEVEARPTATASGEFSATATTLPRLGAAPAILADVFARPSTGALDKVYPVGEGFAVVDVTRRERPTDEALAQQQDTLRAEAVRAKRIELRESFIRALRKSATIVTNEGVLEPAAPSDS